MTTGTSDLSPMSAVTILRAHNAVATKRFYLGRNGAVSKTNYANAKWFAVETTPVAGIADLAALLARLEHATDRFIVRGSLLPDAKPARCRRLVHPDPRTGDAATFAPEARPWALIDMDGIEAPAACDPTIDPEDGIEHLIGLLPPEFHDATCWWQWSSSQGFKGDTLSAHLWFWLDRPIADTDLRRWAETFNHAHGKMIDPALFNAVQPHYTAGPIFDGVPDPLSRRSGLREGLDDAVALVLPGPKPVPARVNAAAMGHAGIGFEGFVTMIGSEAGFRRPVTSAIASWIAINGTDADTETLKHRLRAAIHDADPGPRSQADIERYASDRWLDGIIGWVVARESEVPTPQPVEPYYGATPLPVAEAVHRLHQAVAGFFEQAFAWTDGTVPIHACRSPAGLGKSEEVLDHIARPEAMGKHIAYYLPEHRLADELLERFVAKSDAHGGPRALVFRGRSQEMPDGTPLCRKADIAEAVNALGFRVHETLCEKTEEGKEPERCEYFTGCTYIDQLRLNTPMVRFLPHAYLFIPHGKLPKADINIIDERFWQAALRGMNGKTYVVLPRLKTGHLPRGNGWLDMNRTADLATISARAHDVFHDGTLSPEALLNAGVTASDCRFAAGVWYDLLADLGVTPGMKSSTQRSRIEAYRANEALRMGRFWQLLSKEIDLPRDRLHSLHLWRDTPTKDGLLEDRLVMRWSTNLRISDAPTLLIDADLDAEIGRRFLPSMADPAVIDVARDSARIVQIHDRVVSLTMLAYPGDAPAEQKRTRRRCADLHSIALAEAGR